MIQRLAMLAVPLCALLAGCPAAHAGGGDDEAAVLATVQRFFDTMAASDVAGSREVLIPEGRFFSVRSGPDGPVVGSFTNEEYLDRLPDMGVLLERMWEPEVRVHGDIATVWTRYDFYRGGVFSHCGVDAFNLVREDGRWRIAGGVYTVEVEGCPESPLGPPAHR